MINYHDEILRRIGNRAAGSLMVVVMIFVALGIMAGIGTILNYFGL